MNSESKKDEKTHPPKDSIVCAFNVADFIAEANQRLEKGEKFVDEGDLAAAKAVVGEAEELAAAAQRTYASMLSVDRKRLETRYGEKMHDLNRRIFGLRAAIREARKKASAPKPVEVDESAILEEAPEGAEESQESGAGNNSRIKTV